MVGKLALLSVALAVVLSLSWLIILYQVNEGVSTMPNFLDISINCTQGSHIEGVVKLGVNETGIFEAVMNNSNSEKLEFSWSITPSDNKTLLITNASVCYLNFTEITEKIYCLSVQAKDLVVGNLGSASLMVCEPYAPIVDWTSPEATYSYRIESDGLGGYRAINGQTGNISFTSTNKNAVTSDCLAALSNGGVIVLNQLQFDISLFGYIHEGVIVEQKMKGQDKIFGNLADTQGVPYTITNDGTNIFAQDCQNIYRIVGNSSLDVTLQALIDSDARAINIINNGNTYFFDHQVNVNFPTEHSFEITGYGLPYLVWRSNPFSMKYMFNISVGATWGRSVISGLEMAGSDDTYSNCGGIYVKSTNPLFISNIYMHGFNYSCYNLQETQMLNCRITYSDICVHCFGRCEITNNHIAPNINGVGLIGGQTPDTIFSLNQILGLGGSTFGIKILGEGIKASQNTIRDCDKGIFVAASNYDNNIVDNTIYSFYATCTYGIQDLGNNTWISGNYIYSRSLGTSTIGTGISIHANAENSTVTNNNIYNIATPIRNASATSIICNNCINHIWVAFGY